MDIARRPGTARWRWPWPALGGSIVVLLAGLAIMLAATIFYGDWYLIRRPWGDIGIGLIVIGLLVAGVASVALVISEPLGWWRVAALPGTAVTGTAWFILGVFGLGSAGACCNSISGASLVTTFYSAPVVIPIVAASTFSILLPLPLAALARRVRSA